MTGQETGLRYQLTAQPKPDRVVCTLVVTNQGKESATFTFPTGQESDFAVVLGDQVLWRWSGEMMFTQAFHTLTIRKGRSKTYTVSWDYQTSGGERLKPGPYTILAYFYGVSRQEPVARAEFWVPESP